MSQPTASHLPSGGSADSPPASGEHAWGEIEGFLQELAQLSKSDCSVETYAERLIERIVGILEAEGGAFWMLEGDSELYLRHQRNMSLLELPPTSPPHERHIRFLQSIIHSGEAREASAPSNSASQGTSGPAGDVHREQVSSDGSTWIGAPFRVDGTVVGLLEVVHTSTLNAATMRGNFKLLSMAGELTTDYLEHQRLRQLRCSEERWRQYEQLVRRTQASLDLHSTAYELVNEGRNFVGCDRVSLLIPHGRSLRVYAISGMDTFDRRSLLVQRLESLVEAVVQAGDSLRYRGDTRDLPPQIETHVSPYVDMSHAQSIDVVPLTPLSPSSPVGDRASAVVLERFDTPEGFSSDDQVARFTDLAQVVVQNALDYHTLPLRPVAQFIRRANQIGRLQRFKIIIAAILLVVTCVGLMLIPAKFHVRAEGELQPSIRRDIYAPLDGEVTEVRAGEDQAIGQGETLLVMRSRPLENKLQRLQGEYQTTEKKLFAIASARFQADRSSFPENQRGRLAAEVQELQQLLTSQQEQLALARKQREQLVVSSPIDGRVLTWEASELLADRPVQRGQLLMTVADLTGPWCIELRLPSDRIGYLLQAQREQPEPLDVSFSLASDMGSVYQGTVDNIALRAESIQDNDSFVRVRVSISSPEIDLLRPGAMIYAKVNCGKRSLGFVWLHDLIETLQQWLYF